MTNRGNAIRRDRNRVNLVFLILAILFAGIFFLVWMNRRSLNAQSDRVAELTKQVDKLKNEAAKPTQLSPSTDTIPNIVVKKTNLVEEKPKPKVTSTKVNKPTVASDKGYTSESFLYKGKRYYAFTVDVRKHTLDIFHKKEIGIDIKEVKRKIDAQKKKLIFATNGGIFEGDFSTTGLLVKDNKTIYPLNTKDGNGNFYLKPNGVVYQLEGGKVGLSETNAYQKKGLKPIWAIQSGPMLVVNGKIQNKLNPNSPNAKLRSGVGVIGQHKLVFVISKGNVRFHDIASVFLKKYKSKNALYLDGVISDMYIKKLKNYSTNHAFSSVITVSHE